ncbi:MAG: gerKA [Paenibacillus sp.]|jgi:spore germination protein KA|nr:gerKA [Paenibacillus sp.]
MKGAGALFRKFKRLYKIKKNNSAQHFSTEDLHQESLFEDLERNSEIFHSIYADCTDVNIRTFLIGGETKALLINIEGITDRNEIHLHVLTPLMNVTNGISTQKRGILDYIEQQLTISGVHPVQTFPECVEALSTGNVVLLIDQQNQGVALSLANWEHRSIEEPQAEVGIRGPRESFVETMSVNVSLLRRIIKSPDLKILKTKIGKYTQTVVTVAYIKGITDEKLVEEVKLRLGRIDIDGIMESGYIEALIEDSTFSPFPLILSTERPDVACAQMLEGCVLILTEGTPFALTAPTTLFSFFQSPEDYYQKYSISSILRMLRYFFVSLSLLLPSLYVALLTFHQEMLPTSLLISMAASREAVPFPALIEALIMEVAFEGLREAGVRLPKQVGAAVSIVGALVIGQAAVQAGLISAPMVIIVAITGISSFQVPRYTMGLAIRIIRFPIMLLAGTLGLLGVMMGLIAISIHLATLRSFGVPYLSPITPLKSNEMKDVLTRDPLWKMNTRPHWANSNNIYRQSSGQKPAPPKGRSDKE